MLLTTAFLVATAVVSASSVADAPGVLPIRLSAKWYASLHRRAEAASGSSNMTITGGSTYSTTIEVGTPPQAININIYLSKISQLHLYEGGEHAHLGQDGTPRGYFSPGLSYTFKTTNQTLPETIEYDTPARYDSDVASIGGYSMNDFAFYGINATEDAAIFDAVHNSGNLAIGFDADLNGDFGDPLWKRIVAQGGKAEAGIYLQRTAAVDELWGAPRNTRQDIAGELMLGGLNSKYYQGDINYLNTTIEEDGGVYVHFEGFKVNGERLAATNETLGPPLRLGNRSILFDVSVPGPIYLIPTFSGFGLGNETFTALHAKIPGAQPIPKSTLLYAGIDQAMYVPCNTSVEITLSFNGHDYPLRPQDWISTNSSTPGENCMSMFINMPRVLNWVGAAFAHSVYTAVNFDTRQVGFARLADGLPTRNTTVNGTVTVDVPTATRTYANGESPSTNTESPSTSTESPSTTPTSPAAALRPAFLLRALGVAAAALFV